jgi:cytoskeleton protein RodZ
MPALGDEFRSAREARGLTLSDVAEQLHIRSVYLNAIETEDWKVIGAPVYIRGFIRTYSRFLGLDAESAIAQYNETVPAERPSQAVAAISDDDDRAGPSLWAVIAVVVAIGLVGFVGYEWWSYAQGGGEREPVAASMTPAASNAPTMAATATPTVVPAAGATVAPAASAQPAPTATGSAAGAQGAVTSHQLVVRLTERSWLRVSVDGTTLIEGIYPAGTTRTLNGHTADVRAGNAGGVVVSVDGRPPKGLGKEGDVVEQRYTL